MPSALIVHGSGGGPDEIWFPWLKEKLEQDGFDVLVPQFPVSKEDQKLGSWLEVMEEYQLDGDTIAIGHSLGCPFLLNLLEKRKFKAVYLVAGFTGLLENQFDEWIDTFTDRDFDWKSIKENCSNIHNIYADNDPYVKPEKALKLGKDLGISSILIKGAGHFNTDSNYTEFDRLYKLIRSQ